MTINKTIWDKVGGLVEATFVNIVHQDKVPNSFDRDELKSICYLECGYLISKYKPGPWALTTYVYEFLEKRVVARAYRELEEAKRMQQMLVDETASPQKDGDSMSHEYGDYEFPEYKMLAEHLEDKDLHEQTLKIAIENGLGDIASLLETCTQEEIADKLGISQSMVAYKIKKLRELCKDI